MGTIGVAREYNAYIVNGLTGQVIAALPWSRISWSRLANDVSAASLTVPAADGGIECTGAFGGLRAWTQLLAIERNGAIVWDGPIIGWSRPASKQGGVGDVTIRALDRFAITMKRLLAVDMLGVVTPSALWYLLDGANLDDPSGMPYIYNVPISSAFFDSVSSPIAVTYEVERLERIYDIVQNFVSKSLIDYTQVGATLWPDETERRTLLGGRGARPVLNESNVIGIPGVEVDAMSLATVAYGGAASGGKSGAQVISTQYPMLGLYTDAILHVGEQFPDVATVEPATTTYGAGWSRSTDGYTAALAASTAVPTVTIEQVRLAPNFGCPTLESDLSNLMPGQRVDVDFQDTAAFNYPYVGISYEYRYWYHAIAASDVYDWMKTPVSSDAISVLRLERIDVNVVASDDGIDEEFLASFTPTAEWDGTVPDYWEDTPYDTDYGEP
jgi:hypothetical protein